MRISFDLCIMVTVFFDPSHAPKSDFPGDDEAEFLEASKLKVVTGKDVLLGMCPMG
jgi:hypothetical protein